MLFLMRLELLTYFTKVYAVTYFTEVYEPMHASGLVSESYLPWNIFSRNSQ